MGFKHLAAQLEQRKHDGLLRERQLVESAQQVNLVVDGTDLLNFAANDYLGLAVNPSAQHACAQAINKYGVGAGASHLVTGHQLPHQDFEVAIAEFLQRDKALLFSTGYMANLGVLQALCRKGDLILADKLNHASLIDGARISEAESLRYLHCDIGSLQKRLSRSSQNTFVVTDSVFSMDGDIAPLTEISQLCRRYGATLIVDDAHGFGVLGESGRGSTEHFHLTQKDLPVLISTLGKALGGYGAVVSGEQVLIEYLVQTARSYIYTTAMPAPIAASNLANLEALIKQSDLRQKLHQNIAQFKKLCEQQQIELLPSETPIQPVLVKCNQRLMQVNTYLKQQGILVGAIRPPTVPKNTARLRITISATHTFEQINLLVENLKVALDNTIDASSEV
ncbi:MAG: 8-amino-7-oxononanoate synthase [Kangiellaceae bacterium]|nr:8-amino-7-oxononanoate synthase [Kangiellaceae bacterium]